MIPIPNLKPKATREIVIAKARKQWVKDNPETPMPKDFVLAVRGYYSETIAPPGNNINSYDDAFFIVTENSMTSWNGNTDPTRYGWNKSANKYMARLTEGCWWVRSVSHRGKCQAFGQSSDPVVVDRVREDGTVAKREKGVFGINIHLGGYSTASSEGCQTLPPTQWLDFRNALNEVLSKRGPRIRFILIEGPFS